MPSNARLSFDENIKDIDNLVDLYEGVEALAKADGKGTNGMDVLFRSAGVLMISHWEAYIEDITTEALGHLVQNVGDSAKLPIEIRRLIATELKKEPHDLAIWKIADMGWKEVLKQRLVQMKETRNRSFNTPKAQLTAEFIQKALGIDNIREAWKFGGKSPDENATRLDSLVEVRGQIAHRGRVRQQIDKKYIRESLRLLRELAGKTGGRINQVLDKQTGKPLWKK